MSGSNTFVRCNVPTQTMSRRRRLPRHRRRELGIRRWMRQSRVCGESGRGVAASSLHESRLSRSSSSRARKPSLCIPASRRSRCALAHHRFPVHVSFSDDRHAALSLPPLRTRAWHLFHARAMAVDQNLQSLAFRSSCSISPNVALGCSSYHSPSSSNATDACRVCRIDAIAVGVL